jgi:preprotein translocase subunit SecA
MFEELMHSIWEEFSKLIFRAEMEIDPAQARGAFAANDGNGVALDYSGGTLEGQPSALEQVAASRPMGAQGGTATAMAAGAGNGAPDVVETVVKGEHDKIGRNDPCWCGSGKKFKKCHGA